MCCFFDGRESNLARSHQPASSWGCLEAYWNPHSRANRFSLDTYQVDHIFLYFFWLSCISIPFHQQGSDILNSENRGGVSRNSCVTRPSPEKGASMITDHSLHPPFLLWLVSIAVQIPDPRNCETSCKNALHMHAAFPSSSSLSCDTKPSRYHVLLYEGGCRFQAATAVRA